MCIYLCVCVCEKEREREYERVNNRQLIRLLNLYAFFYYFRKPELIYHTHAVQAPALHAQVLLLMERLINLINHSLMTIRWKKVLFLRVLLTQRQTAQSKLMRKTTSTRALVLVFTVKISASKRCAVVSLPLVNSLRSLELPSYDTQIGNYYKNKFLHYEKFHSS